MPESKRDILPANLDWSPQTTTPDAEVVTFLLADLPALRYAAQLLIEEGNRLPDYPSQLSLSRKLPVVNEEVRTRLLWIGTQLLMVHPLSITTEVEDSSDSDFHLITTETEPGHFLITLQVPEISHEPCSVSLRVDSGFIQWRDECEGVTWHNLISVEDLRGEPGEDGSDGAPGTPGEPGEPGEPGADGEDCDCDGAISPPPPPIDEDAGNNLCGISKYMVEWLDNHFDDILEKASASVDITAKIAAIAAVFISPPLSIVALVVAEVIEDIVEATVEGLRAAVDTDVLEEMRCDLYCRLKDAGEWSYSVYTAWLSHWQIESISRPNLGIAAWVAVGTIPTEHEINERAYIGSVSPSEQCEAECDECADGEWCYRWESFTDMLTEEVGHFSIWLSDPDVDNDYVTSFSDFGALTHIEFGYIFDGNSSGASGAGIWLEQDGASGTQVAGGVPLSSVTSPIVYSVSPEDAFSTPDGLLFGGNVVDGTGTFGMTYVKFKGMGEMPAWTNGEVCEP